MNRFEILTGTIGPMIHEKWICMACGPAPCRVDIQYEKTDLENQQIVGTATRFSFNCVCGSKAGPENRFPEWVQG